ncbi:hypothetical protein [Bacillus luti]
MKNVEAVLNGANNYSGEYAVIFFLEDNMYGYGYTYEKEVGHESMMYQDRFSEEEISDECFDEMLAEENRRAEIGTHDRNIEALSDVINYWSGMEKGKLDTSMDIKSVIELGRKEGLDFIVF